MVLVLKMISQKSTLHRQFLFSGESLNTHLTVGKVENLLRLILELMRPIFELMRYLSEFGKSPFGLKLLHPTK